MSEIPSTGLWSRVSQLKSEPDTALASPEREDARRSTDNSIDSVPFASMLSSLTLPRPIDPTPESTQGSAEASQEGEPIERASEVLAPTSAGSPVATESAAARTGAGGRFVLQVMNAIAGASVTRGDDAAAIPTPVAAIRTSPAGAEAAGAPSTGAQVPASVPTVERSSVPLSVPIPSAAETLPFITTARGAGVVTHDGPVSTAATAPASNGTLGSESVPDPGKVTKLDGLAKIADTDARVVSARVTAAPTSSAPIAVAARLLPDSGADLMLVPSSSPGVDAPRGSTLLADPTRTPYRNGSSPIPDGLELEDPSAPQVILLPSPRESMSTAAATLDDNLSNPARAITRGPASAPSHAGEVIRDRADSIGDHNLFAFAEAEARGETLSLSNALATATKPARSAPETVAVIRVPANVAALATPIDVEGLGPIAPSENELAPKPQATTAASAPLEGAAASGGPANSESGSAVRASESRAPAAHVAPAPELIVDPIGPTPTRSSVRMPIAAGSNPSVATQSPTVAPVAERRHDIAPNQAAADARPQIDGVSGAASPQPAVDEEAVEGNGVGANAGNTRLAFTREAPRPSSVGTTPATSNAGPREVTGAAIPGRATARVTATREDVQASASEGATQASAEPTSGIVGANSVGANAASTHSPIASPKDARIQSSPIPMSSAEPPDALPSTNAPDRPLPEPAPRSAIGDSAEEAAGSTSIARGAASSTAREELSTATSTPASFDDTTTSPPTAPAANPEQAPKLGSKAVVEVARALPDQASASETVSAPAHDAPDASEGNKVQGAALPKHGQQSLDAKAESTRFDSPRARSGDEAPPSGATDTRDGGEGPRLATTRDRRGTPSVAVRTDGGESSAEPARGPARPSSVRESKAGEPESAPSAREAKASVTADTAVSTKVGATEPKVIRDETIVAHAPTSKGPNEGPQAATAEPAETEAAAPPTTRARTTSTRDGRSATEALPIARAQSGGVEPPAAKQEQAPSLKEGAPRPSTLPSAGVSTVHDDSKPANRESRPSEPRPASLAADATTATARAPEHNVRAERPTVGKEEQPSILAADAGTARPRVAGGTKAAAASSAGLTPSTPEASPNAPKVTMDASAATTAAANATRESIEPAKSKVSAIESPEASPSRASNPTGNVVSLPPTESAAPVIPAGVPDRATATPTSTLVELPAQLPQVVRLALNEAKGEARIQLMPPDLGAIQIRLRMTGRTVHASMTVEREEVRALVSGLHDDLRRRLDGAGFKLESLEVTTTRAGMPADPAIVNAPAATSSSMPASSGDARSDAHGDARGQSRGDQGRDSREPSRPEAPLPKEQRNRAGQSARGVDVRV